MIVCVSPSLSDAEETLNVLKFSAVTQEVSTKPSDAGATPTGACSNNMRTYRSSAAQGSKQAAVRCSVGCGADKQARPTPPRSQPSLRSTPATSRPPRQRHVSIDGWIMVIALTKTRRSVQHCII